MTVKLGLSLRVMGPQSSPATLLACARAADEAGVDDLWVADHIAIPPDDAEGSGGRYLDPLATLAFLAGSTERIGLGTGVLILPYRPPLPTAKLIATIQELSGGRLRVGVGVGWMDPEFRVLGVERKRRGEITDATLDFFERCFSDDVVEANGQPFLFLPRPDRPPMFVGGAPPHALRRAVRYGDGWMPMGADPARLAGPIRQLHELADEHDRPTPEVVVLAGLDLAETARAVDHIGRLNEIGVTRVVHAARYENTAEYRGNVDALAKLRAELD